MAKEIGEKGNVLVIEGIPGASASDSQNRGVLAGLAESPNNQLAGHIDRRHAGYEKSNVIKYHRLRLKFKEIKDFVKHRRKHYQTQRISDEFLVRTDFLVHQQYYDSFNPQRDSADK